jgi:hypothetical protein
VRNQPRRSIVRQNAPTPPQPRRQPPRELRPLPDRHHPTPLVPPHPRLRQTPHHRRTVQTRHHPLPETLHRARSTRSSPSPRKHQPSCPPPLDKHRGIITLRRQLRVLPPQPSQLEALVLAEPAVAVLGLTVQGHPVGQRARVDPQVLRYPRDRVAGLADLRRVRPTNGVSG